MPEPVLIIRFDEPGVLTLTLNRPEARNALNEPLIEALYRAVSEAGERRDVRLVVLAATGSAFCAGADIGWMERAAAMTPEENTADAARFAILLEALDQLPQPLVGVARGIAVGGGVGLLAACDIVIASANAGFQFRETRLGLAPATIAPLVIRRIGPARAVALFLSGRRLDAEGAREAGLAYHIVPDGDNLEAAVSSLIRDLLAGGPESHRAIKALVRSTRPGTRPSEFAALLARLRSSDEAREGFRAFRERRRPSWDPGD